ncbi:MAG TPA: nicotinate phosphoribosyltransferase [Candidatus Binatia bacterium]|jgi:nicotinate phosphoribosyltransferase|nr:nicotinate phosphoribosyltransferase [Candidatus Binatia bacterium]
MASQNSFALFTDLYELTMAASYFQHRMFAPATFSLFVRTLPPDRGFLVAAGLEEIVHFLETFAFSADDLAFLQQTGRFQADFLDYLAHLRFTGDLYALPEGRLCFAHEPLLEITAPIIEAQVIETFVLNAVHLQTLIASKAARCYSAARGRLLVDFALRRTHGIDAGLKVARASYLAGFAGTSNVLAGKLYGVPFYGTMAHSFIQSFDDEEAAFTAYAETFPEETALLIDTYDTLAGAQRAAHVGQALQQRGYRLRGVRLDSGDLLTLSQQTRKILDAAGLTDTRIYASGGLNEHEVARLVAAGTPIDVFGVGTDLGVSGDAPALDMAYKLVEYAGRPRLKLSSKKVSLLGKKQVFRIMDADGQYARDFLGLREDSPDEVARAAEISVERVTPLLKKVMENGRLLHPLPLLDESRELCLTDFARLPEVYKALHAPTLYPVSLTPTLARFQDEAVAQLRARYGLITPSVPVQGRR